MSARTHRPLRPTNSSPQPLSRLATQIDDAFHDLSRDEPAQLLRVVANPDQPEAVELGLLPLEPGDHPADIMAGFTAPAGWVAVGVVTTGHSHQLDPADRGERPGRPTQPDAASGPIRLTFLLNRTGEAISLLTPIGSPRSFRRVLDEPPQGVLADACRRVLGLPTAPPAEGPQVWLAARWLDRLLAEAIAEPGAVATWEEAVRLHPLVVAGTTPSPEALVQLIDHAATSFGWEQLRLLATRSDAADPLVLPAVAAWMDSGCFARHVLSAELPIDLMLVELEGLAPESVVRAVKKALARRYPPGHDASPFPSR